jgi:predicted RNA binding protein YcfA (HicA-like mRNA interferase family)
MKAKEIAEKLEALGATYREARGSHRLYRIGGCTTTLSMQRGEIPRGTLRAIERQMEPCLGKNWLGR